MLAKQYNDIIENNTVIMCRQMVGKGFRSRFTAGSGQFAITEASMCDYKNKKIKLENMLGSSKHSKHNKIKNDS